MPVRQPGARTRNYEDEDDYSYSLRRNASRDFAQERRFGREDYDKVLSQVSSPLRVNQLGPPPSKRLSPFGGSSSSCDSPTYEPRPSSYRRQDLSTPVRHALAYMDDYESEDFGVALPPQLSRSKKSSGDSRPRYHPHQQEQTRQGRSKPASSLYWDVEEDYVEPPRSTRGRYYEELERENEMEYPSYDYAKMEGQLKREEGRRGGARQQVDDYVMPVTKRRPDSSLEEEEDAAREIASYIAKRKEFAIDNDDDRFTMKKSKYQYRTRGPALNDCDEPWSAQKKSRENLQHAPMFMMKLRSHVIWEKMYVKFTCTINGSPPPKITWYHDMVPIEPILMDPGKVKISNQYGVYTLEIFKAELSDSGTYRISAQNHKGEISSYATLLVRRYDDGKVGYYDIKSGYNMRKPSDYPDVEKLNVPGYPRFVTGLFNRKVKEGGAVVMTCEVEGRPSPDVFWTLNGRNLDNKVNHVQTEFDGKTASLTILKAYTDDEGEYVCRAYNSCGASTSRCFLSVTGVNSPPSAPTDLQYADVTRNHVTLSWKPPGYCGHFGGAPIVGYWIEKAEAGSSIWRRAISKPVRLTSTPVTGLNEGIGYFFRVRAFNRWGKGPSSLAVGPVAMRDPGTPRLDVELIDLVSPEAEDIVVEEEEPDDVPDIPCNVTATISSSGHCASVSWVAPDSDEVAGFFVEYCDVDSHEEWRCVNGEPLQTTDPYPVMGLESGKSYRFRVIAVNGAGSSEPSNPSDVISINAKVLPEENKLCGNVTDEQLEEEQDFQDLDASCWEKSKGTSERYRGVPTTPREVRSIKCAREYIEIGWVPPARSGGEQPRYYIEYKLLGSDAWLAANHTPVRYTRYPVGGLEPGERYMFRVRAVNSNGTSPFSEPSEAVLASDGIKPPNWWGGVQGIFRVADDKGQPCVTSTSIKVCWEAPRSDGGSNVTGYFLEYRPAGGKFKPVNNKALTQRHFTVGDLNPGEFFEFRVRACNVAGFGEWKILPGEIQAKEPDRPSDPREVNIDDLTEDCVKLSWKKPERMGYGEFMGYLVERRKEHSENWIPCNKLPEQVQKEKYAVAGLVKGNTYFFRVTAVNQIGPGLPSLQSCYVTPGEPFEEVMNRQEAIREIARKKREAEFERLRLLEEAERREAYIFKISDCYADVGGKALFECKVKDSKTKVKWFFGNGKEIPVGPAGKYDVISVGTIRSLIVNNCQAEDVQVVHCVALYNNCTCAADLIVGEMQPLHFLKTPGDVYITEGQKAVFDCLFSKPNVKVAWFMNDAPIDANSDSRYEFIVQGCARSLIINDVTRDDIAMYRLSGLGGTHTANLVVDGVLPVKFNQKLADSEFSHDTRIALFECFADPSPLFNGRLPACKWYHGSELIDSGDERYELVSVGNRHSLKIISPTFEDNGVITCVVEGGRTSCSINVEKPPPPPPKPAKAEDYIINFQQGLRAEALAGAVRLFCIVTKLRDDMHIIWYHNNEEILIDNNLYKCLNDTESGLVSLLITPISRDHAGGKFTCEFITPLSTFDTKVNFEFDEEEFEKISEKAAELLREEEDERRERLAERKRKKDERLNKTSEATVGETPIKQPESADPVIIEDGMQHDVTVDGFIRLSIQTNTKMSECDVTWLKDSVAVNDERYVSDNVETLATLLITDPCADDAGTFTCQVTSSQSKAEASADVTGKVFKQLLLQSAEIRTAKTNTETAAPAQEVNIQSSENPVAETEDTENQTEAPVPQQNETEPRDSSTGVDGSDVTVEAN